MWNLHTRKDVHVGIKDVGPISADILSRIIQLINLLIFCSDFDKLHDSLELWLTLPFGKGSVLFFLRHSFLWHIAFILITDNSTSAFLSRSIFR